MITFGAALWLCLAQAPQDTHIQESFFVGFHRGHLNIQEEGAKALGGALGECQEEHPGETCKILCWSSDDADMPDPLAFL